MKEGNKRKYQIRDILLVFTGDSFLVISESPFTITPPHFETVYMFNTTNRSWLALTLLAGTLAGSIAALLNWIMN